MMSKIKKFAPADCVKRLRTPGAAVLVVLIAMGSWGCKPAGPAPAAAQAPPPAPVTVAHPMEKEVVEWDIYTGHLEAPESAVVAARVSGLIMEAPFAEGSIVKKGDLLFVIDDRPFKADLDAKLADQERVEAQLSLAKLNYNRLAPLLNRASTQQEVDEAKADVDQAAAMVASAKAAVETSRLNLEWCRVLSPIDGRVSNKRVTVGNLVNGGAGQATLLTTIQSVTPMYCYVDVDENSVLKYQKLTAEGKLTNTRGGKVPCYLELGNETGFPHEGIIDFVDNHIDVTTGTQRIRGVLENKSGEFTPGFFTRLRIPGSGRYQALLVPDTAIGNDQDQRTMLVVDKDNKVGVRVVQVGALFGTLRAIVSGLTPDDRVIINGQMHTRPGATVAPTEEPIKVDEAAFVNPASAIVSATSTTEGLRPVVAMNSTSATQPSLQTTTGNAQ
jgi:membrane fusion protein, multidrug efflux system